MAQDDLDQEIVNPVTTNAPTSKNPLLTLLLIFNLVAFAVVAYFQYETINREANKPDIVNLIKEMQKPVNPDLDDEKPFTNEIKKENLFELDSFTVNLATNDGPRRFVRLNAVLKLSDTTQFSEIEARKPQIRDTVINILNSKRPEDLLKREGKYHLKQEIKSSINSFLIDGQVLDIFYVGFQIN
jgi:flagellar FliL protein